MPARYSIQLPLQSVVSLDREPPVVLVPGMPAIVPSNQEERGLKFFFYRFVTAVSGVQGSSYGLESAPLLRTIPVEAPIRNAVIAAGLGALSNVFKDRSLLVVARGKYLTVSPDILGWSPDIIPSSETDLLPAIHLIDILIRFMKFHSSTQLDTDPIPSPESVVQAALHLDEEMEEWEKHLPERWMFIVKEPGDLQHTFNGKYLV